MSVQRSASAGPLLKETLRLYRAHALLFIGVVALLDIPLQIVSLVLNLTAPRIPPFTVSVLLNLPSTRGSIIRFIHPLTTEHIVAFAGIGVRAVVGFVLSSFVGTLTTAALAVVIVGLRDGRHVSIRAAYRAVRERLNALIVAFLWAGARFIVLFLLCPTVIGLVLFIYFLVAWALIPQMVMLEGSSGGVASRRSRQTIKGRWRLASNLFIAVVVLTLVLIAVLPAILTPLLAQPLGLPTPLVQAILATVVALFVQPLAAAATTTLYIDLTGHSDVSTMPTSSRDRRLRRGASTVAPRRGDKRVILHRSSSPAPYL